MALLIKMTLKSIQQSNQCQTSVIGGSFEVMFMNNNKSQVPLTVIKVHISQNRDVKQSMDGCIDNSCLNGICKRTYLNNT